MNSESNNTQDIKITRERTREAIKKRDKTRKAIADKTADYFGLHHRTATITVRTTPEMRERTFKHAQARGMSASEYINHLLETIMGL